ncbi:MAG: response regulator [Ruminococcus sp.]|nr:response regulator [Ruminococcus sp.]
MKLHKKVLISDDGSFFVRHLEQKLTEYGMKVCCKKFTEKTMVGVLAAEKPDLVILNTMGGRDNICRFIEKIRKRKPKIRIFVLSSNIMESFCRSLIEAGADCCMIQPALTHNIYILIMEQLFGFSAKNELERRIAIFLAKRGLPMDAPGFALFCSAVSKVICEPDSLENFTDIYSCLAEIHDTTYEIAERDIRRLTAVAYREGVYWSLPAMTNVRGEKPPTNKEIIFAAADAFVRSYNVFEQIKN